MKPPKWIGFCDCSIYHKNILLPRRKYRIFLSGKLITEPRHFFEKKASRLNLLSVYLVGKEKWPAGRI